jgi:hypothetical protein
MSSLKHLQHQMPSVYLLSLVSSTNTPSNLPVALALPRFCPPCQDWDYAVTTEKRPGHALAFSMALRDTSRPTIEVYQVNSHLGLNMVRVTQPDTSLEYASEA